MLVTPFVALSNNILDLNEVNNTILDIFHHPIFLNPTKSIQFFFYWEKFCPINCWFWFYKLTFEVSFLFVWQISGETASSTVNAGSLSDLSNVANVSLYGFEDYHGIDIGVVRAVRLWYAPVGGELSVEIKLREEDTKLGFAISRTEEVSLFWTDFNQFLK